MIKRVRCRGKDKTPAKGKGCGALVAPEFVNVDGLCECCQLQPALFEPREETEAAFRARVWTHRPGQPDLPARREEDW